MSRPGYNPIGLEIIIPARLAEFSRRDRVKILDGLLEDIDLKRVIMSNKEVLEAWDKAVKEFLDKDLYY